MGVKQKIIGEVELRLGDCGKILADFPSDSVDLIVTSPPYAQRRKATYGGVSPKNYVRWFLPLAEQFLRVLKPSGTFILNIKENAEAGERLTYVLELILALREQGWLWTEEFVWHKKNAYPGHWPNRFRDSWERLLQFNKTRRFRMRQKSVMVPIGDWAEGRLRKMGDNDLRRSKPATGSGMGRNVSNWAGKGMVNPSNVLHLSAECGNKKHSAVFPESLPEWFINLFTDEGDTVLDPFMGSGTSVVVAKRMKRRGIGIEIAEEYFRVACDRLQKTSARPRSAKAIFPTAHSALAESGRENGRRKAA